MLKITITVSESWDNEKEEFVYERYELELEHSLVSLSKWESEFEKLFMTSDEKSKEEIFGYVRCMNLTPEIPPEVFQHLSDENVTQINDYINAKHTGTTFPERKEPPAREKISSELIYYWLTSYQIPWEAQYWHLNRLFTLIKVFNVKNEKPNKKMNRGEMMDRRRQLNEQRRRELGTAG